MKNIVLVSNPFGFGPVGKLHSIATEFFPLVKQEKVSLTFIGSRNSWEIIKDKNINWVEANERSEEKLRLALSKIDKPYVISSQNRFSIKVAKDLNLPCAFLDGLAWFWDEIPNSHLLADIIFWIKYPGMKDRIIPQYNINLVSGISQEKSKSRKPTKTIMIHLGGGINPLTSTLPIDWLDILILALKKIGAKELFICGGKELIMYLQKSIPKDKINSATLDHNEFRKKLSNAQRLVTVGGQSAIMEALSFGVPTTFLPSYNLSQATMVENLRKSKAAPLRFDWQDLNFSIPFGKEKTAIETYDSYARQVKENHWFLTEAIDKIRSLIEDRFSHSGQTKFIKNLGCSGSKEIYNILEKLWSLN